MAKARADAMGSVNWLAVILAANLAVALRIVWYGPLMGRRTMVGRPGEPRRSPLSWAAIVLIMLFAAAMLGHMFARTSPDKPWLYFMMSGGVAVAFIWPALWLAYGRRQVPAEETGIEAAYWLLAYLAMGAVFWALA